jgi:phospholipid/cholesterol/gamma-HCH transport system substrate-binding protein
LSDVRGIKTDSSASIQFAGLLGQNYVAISFGSAAGQTITEGSSLTVSQQPDLGDIMNKIDSVASGVKNFTEAINPDDFKNLLGPFADFLKDNSPRVSVILSNAATISTQVAEGKGTVGKLIMDDTLYTAAVDAVTNLNATAGDIQGTITEAREVVNQVTAGQGTIGRLVKDEALYVETTNAMTALREILQKINLGQGSVGKLVNDDSFYRNIKVSLQKLDKAAESLEDQGPVSVLGIAVGSLF